MFKYFVFAFRHSYKVSVSPQLSENYCRNPDVDGDRPWCYTVNLYSRWEYCDIPMCRNCKYNIQIISISCIDTEEWLMHCIVFIEICKTWIMANLKPNYI